VSALPSGRCSSIGNPVRSHCVGHGAIEALTSRERVDQAPPEGSGICAGGQYSPYLCLKCGDGSRGVILSGTLELPIEFTYPGHPTLSKEIVKSLVESGVVALRAAEHHNDCSREEPLSDDP